MKTFSEDEGKSRISFSHGNTTEKVWDELPLQKNTRNFSDHFVLFLWSIVLWYYSSLGALSFQFLQELSNQLKK